MRAKRGSLLGLIPLLAPVLLRAASPSLFGRGIVSLSFRGDAPADEAEWSALTRLGPGQTLTAEGVRTSLRNLWATRRFTDLMVEAAPDGEGTRVVVVFSAVPGIERLDISRGVPGRGRILDALGLGPGDPWPEERLPALEDAVRTALRDEGYFEASVRAHVDPGRAPACVDVRFDVSPGRRARGGPPEWVGETGPLQPPELARAAHQKAGRPFIESRARKDAERYEDLYRRKGYSRAEVRWQGLRYDPALAMVTPRYRVFAGPRVILKVVGASLSGVKNHPESPWERGEPPDEDAVQHLRDALERTYQEHGYARAKVDVTTEASTAQEETITFTVNRGDRFSVAHVSLEVLGSVRASEAMSVLETRPRGLVSTGRLVDATLAADQEALAGLLRSKGFAYARVGDARVADGRSPFTLDVTFPLEEGRRYSLGKVSLTGVSGLPLRDVEKALGLTPGSPYQAGRVSEGVARLRQFYLDHGYPDVHVEESTALEEAGSADPLQSDVACRVTEGDFVRFGKTVVRGNRRTKTSVIRREVAWREGDPYSFSRLIETQQALTRLGVFQRTNLFDLLVLERGLDHAQHA